MEHVVRSVAWWVLVLPLASIASGCSSDGHDGAPDAATGAAEVDAGPGRGDDDEGDESNEGGKDAGPAPALRPPGPLPDAGQSAALMDGSTPASDRIDAGDGPSPTPEPAHDEDGGAGALPSDPNSPGAPLCTLDCEPLEAGPDSDRPFDLASNPSEGIGLDAEGNLVLRRRAATGDPIIWIANTAEGTVSKVDSEAFTELGRYNIPAVDFNVNPDQNGPSRTSVDSRGDVYVGARFGSGVSKVSAAGDSCPDSNSDGVITTSRSDSDVLRAGEDDCLVWTTDIGGDARGVAVQDTPARFRLASDGAGGLAVEEVPAERAVWVGGRDTVQLLKLDADTGARLLALTPPVKVYGLALDGRGQLWIASREVGAFGRIDTARCTSDECGGASLCSTICSETSCPDTCDDAVMERIEPLLDPADTSGTGSYGITIDCKQRVWLGGAHGSQGVKRYDPRAPADQRLTLQLAVGGLEADGIHGIAADGAGWIWGAARNLGVFRIDAETLDFRQVAGTGGVSGDAKGIAVDRAGQIWAIPLRQNYAMVIAPGAGIDDASVSWPMDRFVAPYTYSDFSGEQRRLVARDPGTYRQLFDGCAPGSETRWESLSWQANAPYGTFVLFRARTAATLPALERAPFFNVAVVGGRGAAPATPAALGPALAAAMQAPGRYLELEVHMQSETWTDPATPGCPELAATSPSVKRVALEYSCR